MGSKFERLRQVEASLGAWLGLLRQDTANAYASSLSHLARLAASDGHPTADAAYFGLWAVEQPSEFTTWMQRFLDCGPGAAATRKKQASAVSGMGKQLRRARLPFPAWRPRQPPRDSARALVAAADWSRRVVVHLEADPYDVGALRSLAMMRLAECGLRESEIEGLRLPEATALVPNLALGSDRVWLTAETWAAIARWTDCRGRGAGPLFVAFDGRSGRMTNRRMTARTIQRAIAETADVCGLGPITLSAIRRRAIIAAMDERGVRHAAAMARVQNAGDLTAARQGRWASGDGRRLT